MNRTSIIDERGDEDIVEITITLDEFDPVCIDCNKVMIFCYECGVYMCDVCLADHINYCEKTDIYICDKCNNAPYTTVSILECTDCNIKRCTDCTVFYNCNMIICEMCNLDKVCKSCNYSAQ